MRTLALFSLACALVAFAAGLALAWESSPRAARVIALEGRVEQLEGALDKADARAKSYEREYQRLREKVRRFEREHNARASR